MSKQLTSRSFLTGYTKNGEITPTLPFIHII